MAAAVALAMVGCGADDAPPTPGPPAVQRIDIGSGERGAAVFRPAGVARPLPVVVCIHGLYATDPETYGAWIRHIVREGYMVVYPTYQQGLTPPAAYLANTVAGVRAALARLPVQRGRLVVAGHSAGGALAADYAAAAGDLGVPSPRAVVAVYPGRALEGFPLRIPAADATGIPRATRILALAGADDRTVGATTAREIVRDATSVPRARRTFRLVNDPRVDYHLAPLRTDAVARRTFWAPLDRLLRQDP